MISDKYVEATGKFISAEKSRNIDKVKLVMNEWCTKMLQKHTTNVIPINLTLKASKKNKLLVS